EDPYRTYRLVPRDGRQPIGRDALSAGCGAHVAFRGAWAAMDGRPRAAGTHFRRPPGRRHVCRVPPAPNLHEGPTPEPRDVPSAGVGMSGLLERMAWA